jgi:ABC-2 type transport system permease protein
MFTAFGTAFASVISDFQGFQLVMNFLVMPIYFLSGAIYPLTNAPRVLEWIATVDPLSYGVDGLRGVLTGISHFSVATDLVVLGLLSAGFVALGGFLFSKVQV